ncbi:DNA-3-methyladenine glycosylase family protein [Jongsikchunia kroppenstedtii]|uniref:DNA-3-methyladenine glycosylase family protein n=1 Tax=Jongsikchunia kroppenstedtii TaxID=1121721 RepID=UPI0004773311|nr:hypothetical protein [Jongsikchunia kroppenstedtii]
MDVAATLGIHRRGGGDPAYHVTRGGTIAVGSCTPDGAAVLAISREDKTVLGRAWGDGAHWLLDRLPTLLGADDDPAALVPHHDVVARLIKAKPGLRIGRTDRVFEALVPAVLEQKVPGAEAWRSWRYLIRHHGIAVAGVDAVKSPPSQQDWAAIPSWEWHRAGAEPVRMRTVKAAAAFDVESRVDQLRSIRGIGPWTEAHVRVRALGDPDAVPVGDYHTPGMVGGVLAHRKVDNDGMLELLEPYAGQRYRAIRLMELGVPSPPRRGHRMSVRDCRAF